MKNFIALFLLFASLSGFATNYQTIDVNGTIKWSTDGGASDCGCEANAAGKQDSILVYHGYTFPLGYFGSDGEIVSSMRVSAGTINQVVFEDEIVLEKITMVVDGSVVTFNGAFDISSAGQNLGGVASYGNSVIEFNGDFGGKKRGKNKAVIAMVSSTVNFADGILVDGIKIITDFNSNVHIGANTDLIDAYIINSPGSALFIGDGVRFEHTEFFLYSNNVTFGNNVRFSDESVVGFGENVNATIPGTTKFTHSTINFFSPDNQSGAIVNFSSGIQLIDCEMHITNGAIANMDDPYISEGPDRNSVVTVDGLLDLDGVVAILNTDITVQSSGIINLLNATSCDFTGSTVNGKNSDASDVLTCGDTYNPDDNDFNIWENGSWSQGIAPNHVGVLAEIRTVYSTAVGGNILCGNLYIEEEVASTIDEEGWVRATQDFNNLGTMTIKNGGSLIMDQNTYFHVENGLFNVERQGQLSAMKFNVWSSPIADHGLFETFPLANPCDMFVFDGTIQNWKYDFEVGTEVLCGPNQDTVVFGPNDVVTDADGKMNAGLGYFIPGNDQSSVRVFSGQVNNGLLTQRVNTTNLGANPNWGGDDWNLIGNPYPSGLDLNLFWGRNAVQNRFLTDGLYFWVETVDPPYNAIGSYESWNFTGGTYFYHDGEPNGIDGLVPAGLGFWAVANDPTNDGSKTYNVIFDNTMRSNNQVSGTASKNYSYSPAEHQRVWVNLTNDSMQYDQILMGIHPLATDSIDLLFDAHLNWGGEPLVLAMVNEDQFFAIQGFAPRVKVDTSMIELLVAASNGSNHYLMVDSSITYLTEKRIFLVDSLKGTEEEMLLDQPLTLDIDSAGRYDQRFYLKITNTHITSVKSVQEPIKGRAWVTDGSLYYDSFSHNISAIKVFDVLGAQVYSGNPNNRNSSVRLPDLSTGIFIIQFQDSLGRRMTQKVFIQ